MKRRRFGFRSPATTSDSASRPEPGQYSWPEYEALREARIREAFLAHDPVAHDLARMRHKSRVDRQPVELGFNLAEQLERFVTLSGIAWAHIFRCISNLFKE